jgi:uncharacterized membrane protein
MSGRALRTTLIALAALGIALAGYLTYLHYSGTTPPCSIKGNPCSQVQKSRYSELAGVPVALIGLLGYILILGSLLAPESERARFATMGLTLGGLGFSAYLTYREIFTLHKICEWCVGSAVLMTIMVCLSVWRFLRGDIDARTRMLAELDGSQPDTPAAALPG